MKLVFCCCCWSELTSNISQVVWSGCWILSPDWQQFSFSSYHRPRCKHGCRMMCLRGGAGFCLYSQSSWPFALFCVLAGKVSNKFKKRCLVICKQQDPPMIPVKCYQDEINRASPLFLCNGMWKPGRADWERVVACKGVPGLDNGRIRTMGHVLQAASSLCP